MAFSNVEKHQEMVTLFYMIANECFCWEFLVDDIIIQVWDTMTSVISSG